MTFQTISILIKVIKGTCRLWNISIAAVIFLTVYNVMLTARLMHAPAECPPPPPPKTEIIYQKCDATRTETKNDGFEEDNINLNLELGLGRWDDSRRYKIYDNIIIGDRYGTLNEAYQTCLATQGSLEKLLSVIEVANHWNGPISLAVFAAYEAELNNLLMFLLYLRKCNTKIKDAITFHLLIAEKMPNSFTLDLDTLAELECSQPTTVHRQLVNNMNRAANKWRIKLPYPQNHMRNLARKNCQTKYVFLTDVDVIPSKGMAEHLDEFLETSECNGKCAYVVPTFELDERVSFPHNKTELIRLALKGLARPFHHKVFIYNQYATNFTRWQNQFNEDTKVHISHPVTNFEFLYEPFYIATDAAPPHDERFVGYGYTRNSQVYEMYVAGYDFLVLSPIFTCHWGLQMKKTRPPWREHQNNLNRKQFDIFKKEVFAKYNKDPLNFFGRKQ